MVKLVTPTEIAEPIAYLMGGSAGMPPLFASLVPYGVHLALSVYDDRKDTIVREVDGKREELDGVAARWVTRQKLQLTRQHTPVAQPSRRTAGARAPGRPPALAHQEGRGGRGCRWRRQDPGFVHGCEPAGQVQRQAAFGGGLVYTFSSADTFTGNGHSRPGGARDRAAD